jgi:hypothetical protein
MGWVAVAKVSYIQPGRGRGVIDQCLRRKQHSNKNVVTSWPSPPSPEMATESTVHLYNEIVHLFCL